MCWHEIGRPARWVQANSMTTFGPSANIRSVNDPTYGQIPTKLIETITSSQAAFKIYCSTLWFHLHIALNSLSVGFYYSVSNCAVCWPLEQTHFDDNTTHCIWGRSILTTAVHKKKRKGITFVNAREDDVRAGFTGFCTNIILFTRLARDFQLCCGSCFPCYTRRAKSSRSIVTMAAQLHPPLHFSFLPFSVFFRLLSFASAPVRASDTSALYLSL